MLYSDNKVRLIHHKVVRVAFALLFVLCYAQPIVAWSDDDEATSFCLGLGWNIGNQLDAFNDGVSDENCWEIRLLLNRLLPMWQKLVLLPCVFL